MPNVRIVSLRLVPLMRDAFPIEAINNSSPMFRSVFVYNTDGNGSSVAGKRMSSTIYG